MRYESSKEQTSLLVIAFVDIGFAENLSDCHRYRHEIIAFSINYKIIKFVWKKIFTLVLNISFIRKKGKNESSFA